MNDTRLTLFVDAHWDSPYVYSCFVALREKGLIFQTVPVSLDDRAQLLPEYARPSVTARVPAIRHGLKDEADAFWLSESTAIIEYLDEVFPEKRVIPTEIRDRARVRQTMSWLRSDLLALREDRSTATVFHERATKPLSDAGKQAADKLIRVAGELLSAGRPTIAAAWSIADADLTLMLARLIINNHDVPAPLRAYFDSNWKRPSIRAFVDHKRPPHKAP